MGSSQNTVKNVLQGGSLKEQHGKFTRTGHCGILEGKDYRALDKVFPLVAVSIDPSKECEKMTPMTRTQSRSSNVTANVTRGIGQQT